jgi:hypothetical protein
MEGLLLVAAMECLAASILIKEKMREEAILKKWKRGELSYKELLGLKNDGTIHVRCLNKNVHSAKNTGYSKKND